VGDAVDTAAVYDALAVITFVVTSTCVAFTRATLIALIGTPPPLTVNV
jgi:hypothetical protein